MKINSGNKLMTAMVLSAVISGCAGVVSKPTSEADRVTTGEYDGVWKVQVQKSAVVQNISNWKLTCGDMQRAFDIRVKNGTINTNSGKNSDTTYVSSAGEFKIVLPIDAKTKASASSHATIANGKMKIILSGTLGSENATGIITYGIADLGYAGCTAKTRFTLLGQPSNGSNS